MGPLAGLRVVEMAGLGPAPFAGMVLSDMGAEILRVDKPPGSYRLFDPTSDALGRGRRSVAVDVKHADGTEVVLRLIAQADVLLDPYRPGVLERLGLGPDVCLARNPALVYGRMTGFGQHAADGAPDSPLVDAPGHDINYIAIGGALGSIGRKGQPPTPPLNLIGDFGGGGMLLVVGVLARPAARQGHRRGGQVVDAAMVDGTAMLMTPFFGARERWAGRGTTTLDSGAPFYDVYETADGRYVAVGAMEAQFFAALVDGLGLDPALNAQQWDQSAWPEAPPADRRRLQDPHARRVVRPARGHRRLRVAPPPRAAPTPPGQLHARARSPRSRARRGSPAARPAGGGTATRRSSAQAGWARGLRRGNLWGERGRRCRSRTRRSRKSSATSCGSTSAS